MEILCNDPILKAALERPFRQQQSGYDNDFDYDMEPPSIRMTTGRDTPITAEEIFETQKRLDAMGQRILKRLNSGHKPAQRRPEPRREYTSASLDTSDIIVRPGGPSFREQLDERRGPNGRVIGMTQIGPQSIFDPPPTPVVSDTARIRAAQKKINLEVRRRSDAEKRVYKLLGQKEYIKARLPKLNPGKKKDSKKIIKYNAKLGKIDYEMTRIHNTHEGIDIILSKREEPQLPWYKRAWNWICGKAKKVKKAVKKFWRNHGEAVKDAVSVLCSIALPVLGFLFMGATSKKVVAAET